MTEPLTIALLAIPLLAAALAALAPATATAAARWNTACALATTAVAVALALPVLADPTAVPARGSWYLIDPAGAVLLLVIAGVGLLSALCSPAQLDRGTLALFGGRFPHRPYYAALNLFWAALLAVPLAANLAVAWLLVEATTAASALLIASSGRHGALEAGWKYLVLTTLGLTVALLGIVLLLAALGGGASLHALDWSTIRRGAHALDPGIATLAAVLILAGLAAKAGWAPVHNWLPDAHSEAPPAVSALLSAALLPAVALVAWRARAALAPSAADAALTNVLLAFGLVSLAVAVPFLWRPLPLKRLLAYSSLEHMGVLALGIGFASPLAIAGVVLHVVAHALAKALGFYATIPLLAADPELARRRAVGIPSRSPAAAGALGVSLATLAGLPPSPLFFSELLILAGGIAAGRLAAVAIAATLLALGFLGLAHAAIEALAGERPAQPHRDRSRSPRLVALTAAIALALAALSATAWMLPGSRLVAQLVRGLA